MDLLRVPHLRPPPPAGSPLRPDPDAPRASEWLARGPAEPRAIVVGAPYAGGSLSGARCDLAPAAVRREMARFSLWSSDLSLSLEEFAVVDAGDVEPDAGTEETQRRVRACLAGLRSRSDVPLALLGGDNSVTVGAALGAGADGLLTFDAHHDCRDPSRGASNGTPVRQLVEAGLGPVVQLGIHGFANGAAPAAWARENGVGWILASAVRAEGIDAAIARAMEVLGEARRIWVDVDLDVLDRAFAPGAPAALPGGLWPADLERAAAALGADHRVVGLDIVELDPDADVAQTTTRAACAVLLAFLAGVASR